MMDDHIREAFAVIARSEDREIDLARAAMLIAATQYPGLDIDRELGALDSLASGIADRLSGERSPLYELNVLSEYLFDELGFSGNRADYYDSRNSLLNDVLRRRLGIPITLSLVYIEVGKRLGVPLVGIGMPGHFLVRHADVQDLYVDAFHGGIMLSEQECAQRLQESTGTAVPWSPSLLEPVTRREFVARMLRNLKGIYIHRQDHSRALAIIESLMLLEPRTPAEQRDRGLAHYRLGDYSEALEDLSAYLDSPQDKQDSGAVQALVARIRTLLDD